MAKCSFCGKSIPKGTGKMFVKKDGTVFFFCSNKCEKNLLVLKRAAKKKKWTEHWQPKETVQKKSKTRGSEKK